MGLRRRRPTKSGGPPLLAPSFKVQGDIAHNRNSGFAVLPQCDDLNAHRVRKVPAVQARILGMSEKPEFHSKMIKDGRWTVAVSTGYCSVSHVGNFATEEEANRWIATYSKNWSQPADKPK